MRKDSFRGKRCLVFRAFLKVLAFVFSWKVFLFGFISFSYCYYWFIFIKKKTLDEYEFSRWEPICCIPLIHNTPCMPGAYNNTLPHWSQWELFDVQSTDVGLHPWTWHPCLIQICGCFSRAACLWVSTVRTWLFQNHRAEHVNLRAEIASLLSVLCSLCSAVPFLKGSESAHSPTSLFNKDYFQSQLQAAKKINLNFP